MPPASTPTILRVTMPGVDNGVVLVSGWLVVPMLSDDSGAIELVERACLRPGDRGEEGKGFSIPGRDEVGGSGWVLAWESGGEV